jgi:hypothetical protein
MFDFGVNSTGDLMPYQCGHVGGIHVSDVGSAVCRQSAPWSVQLALDRAAKRLLRIEVLNHRTTSSLKPHFRAQNQ